MNVKMAIIKLKQIPSISDDSNELAAVEFVLGDAGSHLSFFGFSNRQFRVLVGSLIITPSMLSWRREGLEPSNPFRSQTAFKAAPFTDMVVSPFITIMPVSML